MCWIYLTKFFLTIATQLSWVHKATFTFFLKENASFFKLTQLCWFCKSNTPVFWVLGCSRTCLCSCWWRRSSGTGTSCWPSAGWWTPAQEGVSSAHRPILPPASSDRWGRSPAESWRLFERRLCKIQKQGFNTKIFFSF